MKVTVTEQSASERTLEVVVDAKRVETAFQKAFRKNLKTFALPGFRKGKVPASMAQKYITDAGLVRDVVGELVPSTFEEATEKEALKPISQPEWDLVQSERGKDLIYKASFQVSPIIKVEGYDGLPVTQAREEVTQEFIDETLEKMRNQHAQLVTLEEERGLQEGDHAVVDYKSYQNGEEIEGGGVSNYTIELKSENYIPGFVENLVGLKGGDEKSFEITFPEDYNNTELAGETVTFSFKIHEIKERKLPELDDDFAKSHSEKETLAELKEAIAERLETGVQQQAESEASLTIIKTLLEQVKEEAIPAPLRQHHAQRVIRSRMTELAQRGIGLDQILAARGISQDQWIQEMMGLGLFEARLEVLYRSVARLEGLTISEEELDDVIAAEAPAHKMKPKQLKRQLQRTGGLEQVEFNMLREKVQKHLFAKAKVTYVARSEEAEEEEAQAKAPKSKKASKKSKAKTSEAKAEPAELTEDSSEAPDEATADAESKKAPKAKSKSKAKKKSKAKAAE